jgi:glycosyltransferase involved in cell wall biosynthesis
MVGDHDVDMTATFDIQIDNLPAATRALRVAVVTETYPPEVNGVALSVARLVEGLRLRNHAVQLVRLKQKVGDGTLNAGAQDDVVLKGMPIPRYPHLKMGIPCTRNLVQLWSRQRPDIVHIATEGPLGWSALRAARKLKIPVVSEFRTNFHAYSQHYGLGWLHKPILAYLRKFHNLTQRTLVPTPALQTELVQHGFERVGVLARGVDTVLFSPHRRDDTLRATWGADASTVVIVCVGRLAAEKNLTLLYASWQKAMAQGLRARLVLVGDGPLEEELKRHWKDVVFTGLLRGSDLARAYASADLFAFPSQTETYGNVVPEAMASGLPVVAFDCAAASQLVSDQLSGALAAPGQPEAFTAQLCAAVRALEGGAAWGVAARQQVLSLGWDRIVSELERVMWDIMDSPAPPPPRVELRPLMN